MKTNLSTRPNGKNESSCYCSGKIRPSRLPRKVLMKVKKLTLLEILYKRLLKSKKINKIIFAIPGDKVNRELASFLKKKKLNTS